MFPWRHSALAVVAILATFSGLQAQTLTVSEQEAKLPPLVLRGVMGSPVRGPRIEVVRPESRTALYPPNSRIPLDVKFISRLGYPISEKDVRVVYLRGEGIDKTVQFQLNSDGVTLVQLRGEMMLPAGDHEFLIEVKDVEGRPGGTILKISVR